MSTNSTPTTRTFLSDRSIEILTGVLLAVVAVATAWSVYQAARWAGVQSMRMASGSARRIESTRASSLAGQQTMVDIGLFTNWVNAYVEENEELSQFYLDRFRDEFRPAFNAWVATKPRSNPDAPSSPFAMPEYHLAAQEEADQLEAQANMLVAEGQAALQTNNEYVLTTVFLASVLFFATLSMRLYWRSVKLGVLILAIIMLLVSIGRLISLPVH
jgi:hypothetical protein